MSGAASRQPIFATIGGLALTICRAITTPTNFPVD
jgi:hypothetical protein